MNQNNDTNQEHYQSLEASVFFHKLWETIEKLPDDSPIVKKLEEVPIFFEDLRFVFSPVYINDQFNCVPNKGETEGS